MHRKEFLSPYHHLKKDFICPISDKEAPKVTNCHADLSVLLDSNELRVAVTWDEPQFTDNINITDMKQTHMSGIFCNIQKNKLLKYAFYYCILVEFLTCIKHNCDMNLIDI